MSFDVGPESLSRMTDFMLALLVLRELVHTSNFIYVMHVIFYESDIRYGVTNQHRCTLDQQCGARTWAQLRGTCTRPIMLIFMYEVSIEISIMDSCVHQALSNTFSSCVTNVAHLYCVLLFWVFSSYRPSWVTWCNKWLSYTNRAGNIL